MSEPTRILVTGATGYVGGRLVPRLLDAGYRVRVSSRSLAKLRGRTWSTHPRIELAEMDANDPDTVRAAMHGCAAAYYLVHSMEPGTTRFHEVEERTARNFGQAAADAGVQRIVYLGGLGNADEGALSEHLRSRRRVEDVLREAGVPVTVLRAAMIIGSGSGSFEIMRYLVERLPVMITPRWVSTPVQPIAIRNVLEYLVRVLDVPETAGGTFEIGGPEATTYRVIMEKYAEEAGLPPRVIIPVPVLTPRLSSWWIHLVTPLPSALARPLAEGLRNPVVVKDTRITELVPQDLLTVRESLRRALDARQHHHVLTHWSDAGTPSAWTWHGDSAWAGGTVLEDSRDVAVDASPDATWRAVTRIGGDTGWYHGQALWALRGRIDKLLGGVGLRRGRRHPEVLRPGDALDFWRVADVEPGERLLLVAEMKVPGEALLEFTVRSREEGGSTLTQTARFRPRGLLGMAYWYGLLPVHAYVFRGMARALARAAERAETPAHPRETPGKARPHGENG